MAGPTGEPVRELGSAMHLLVEHLWWTNRRLLDAAARLPEATWSNHSHR